MYVRPTTDITIGNFQFSGVHELRVKRSIHSYMDTASITIPSIARIIKKGKAAPTRVITGSQFTDGDPVIIKAGYNGVVTEFKGFVKRRNLQMPLTVECEGYSRQLRLNNNPITAYFASTTASELLRMAVGEIDGQRKKLPKKTTDITVQCPVDIPIHDVHLIEASGADICDYIKKLTYNTVSIYFIDPTTLWCGLVYTPYSQNTDPMGIGQVKYRLGYNVVKDNDLKERVPIEPVQVIMHNKLATGEHIFSTSQLKAARTKVKRIADHMPSVEWLQKIADEKEHRLNYTGYEGRINAFIEPYAQPGFKAYITEARYLEKNGTYIIESTEVIISPNGKPAAKRICEIGPKIGFGSN